MKQKPQVPAEDPTDGPTKECPGMPDNARRDSLNARECPGVEKQCPE